MSEKVDNIDSIEINRFKAAVEKPHRRISPCFMTGKGCVYTEQIDREFDYRRNSVPKNYSGFMIVPFQPNVSVFYELCLKLYLSGAYADGDEVNIFRADQVRKTGYVICEKICKKIQESNYVIADISVPNANVFYEMGLAYGIGQKIVVIYHHKADFGQKMADYLADAGCKAYKYSDLTPLTIATFPLSKSIWQREHRPFVESLPTTLLLDLPGVPGDDNGKYDKPSDNDNLTFGQKDIVLNFPTHVRAAVGVAIANICKKIEDKRQTLKIPTTYDKLIENLRNTREVQKDANFGEILEKVDQSFCAIIKTGGPDCNPMMYFWLGYCHAQGKNVIPVTIIDEKNGDVDDLAFDIRALWHMTFAKDSPRDLESELEEILYQMIVSDFAEWSRKRFWDTILERRGKVSIFTGALPNQNIGGREMIGDWDLRAASELTSFFASHQYRATIDSPVYQIEQVVDKQQTVSEEEYIHQLEKMLTGRNCVIIASPDVNPLTEIALGKIYGIEQKNWFSLDFNALENPGPVVAFKRNKASAEESRTEITTPRRAFYREDPEDTSENKPNQRGFKASFLPGNRISGGFVSQIDKPKEFEVHAHLVIAPNPFGADRGEPKYLVILNGVSGPATFALTQVLTGGMSGEFVAYDSSFDPNTQSENILKTILDDLRTGQDKGRQVLQYIVKVTVGEPKIAEANQGIFDWRRICRWELLPYKNKSNY
jgi:hypothetical protein